MKKRKCLECKEEFLGRADKKFCSDQCRSAYNNRLNSDGINFVRNINSILRKNRRILEELNPEGKATVHREQLLERGFRFSYFTNEYVTRAGKVYRYCYDQGYLELDNDFFTLVRRKAYVD
ncbi:MAG TPA: hypothetical protein PKE06_05930 [Flavilitoribacter sp.]|nr:hypothetical protein [Flavilitoribacter sp.]HMQ88571.1 hypothetical protein [Flavilitoribacter sp.]